MKNKRIRVFLVLAPLLYAAAVVGANAQVFDPTIQISNQVDASTAETLTASTHQQEHQIFGFNGGKWTAEGSPYSGYSDTPLKGWSSKGVILIESFNEKNSFQGKGVADTYGSQLGWSFQSPVGTSIQPFISYQNSGTDLFGSNSAHSNAYGASLNIAQKILPWFPVFHDRQPNAVYNIGSNKNDPKCPNGEDHTVDHYPSFDVQAGLNLSFGDTNLATYKKGWSYDTQDSYGISPNLSFDFFPKKPSEEGFSLLPNAINIIPTYAYLMAENQSGGSASSGLLSIQDRNVYQWTLTHRNDCDRSPSSSIQLIESNTLLHDTNQESIAPPTGPIAYQNWARFGLAIAYSNLINADPKDPAASKTTTATLPLAKIEYDYDAFNNQYQAHTVLLTVNFNF